MDVLSAEAVAVDAVRSRRAICERCSRPRGAACLCPALPPEPITTRTRVVVLQHPLELRSKLATVPLLRLCLAECHVLVGRRFSLDTHPHLAGLLLPSCASHSLKRTPAQSPGDADSSDPGPRRKHSPGTQGRLRPRGTAPGSSAPVQGRSCGGAADQAGEGRAEGCSESGGAEQVGGERDAAGNSEDAGAPLPRQAYQGQGLCGCGHRRLLLFPSLYATVLQPGGSLPKAAGPGEHAGSLEANLEGAAGCAETEGQPPRWRPGEDGEEPIPESYSPGLRKGEAVCAAGFDTTLFVFDGTWRLAKEMARANDALLSPYYHKVCFPFERDVQGPGVGLGPGGLILKKEPSLGLVSTAEAVARALAVLEPDQGASEAILKALERMVEIQVHHRPSAKADLLQHS